MSPPRTPITEAVSASESERCERVPDLSTTKARMNFLVDALGITPVQAHHRIRSYEQEQRAAERAARAADAREFIAEEFGPWLRRRGDLLVVRGRARREWKVVSS